MTKTKIRYTIPPRQFTPRFEFAEEFYMDEEIRRLLATKTVPPGNGWGWSNIIPAIKYVRSVTGLGLAEAKKYVEKIRDAK